MLNTPTKNNNQKNLHLLSITDPESCKVHTSKGTTQGYNCQTIADGSHQIITATTTPNSNYHDRDPRYEGREKVGVI